TSYLSNSSDNRQISHVYATVPSQVRRRDTGKVLPDGPRRYCLAGADGHFRVGHEVCVGKKRAQRPSLYRRIHNEQAAPIFCAGFTVWSGFRIAEPEPGDRVAVVGVGGLGHLGVQFAKAAGHETIAVTHSKDKEKMLRQLGVDHVVADGDGLQKAGGADVILVTGNSWKAAGDAMKALRPQGRVVLMGVSGDPLQVPVSLLFVEGKILGSSQNDPEHLYEALDFVARGKVKVVTETYSLDEIGKAYDRVEKGEVRFRAVIKP
ncbi:MAG TPA: zinc-binding dehydrogenase, partial [Thermoanaerobaculia bacterium]|nr:zinc-binding dehydrogenase [Thermoanaerobaculia bacterium]